MTLPAGAVSGGLTPASRAANRGWRPPVHRAKGSVESADGREARGKCDRGHRHRGLVDQRFRALHTPRRRHSGRRGAGMPHEQSAQMPGRHSERIREVLDGLAVVEESALDEPQRPRDRSRRAEPRGCPWRGLGSTAQAWAEARPLGGGRGREKDHVARLGRLHRANGPAVDPGGEHAGEEPPVESRVSRDAGAIAPVPVEGEAFSHGDATLAREPGARRASGRRRPKTARRRWAAPLTSGPDMSARYFYGWNIVGATFVMALFSFGLGFYGLTVYLAMLQRLHGWSASAVSAPVTMYYVAGALLTAVIGDVYERHGPRTVVSAGAVAMAAGVVALGVVTRPWQLYPAFLVMSVGWGSMSGAAINIILAPWFERRPGLAVSIAFNGATLGGVGVAPALIPIIGAVGFTRVLACAAVVLLAVLGAV